MSRICVELLFGAVDRFENVRSGGRIVGVQQFDIQLRELLLRRHWVRAAR